MDLLNERVEHSSFGQGVVTGQSSSTVTVSFGEEYGSKKFLYPKAFDSFLMLCDDEAKQGMDGELRVIHEREQAERERAAQEESERQEERRRALQAEKKAAAKKRTTTKKTAK